MTDAVLAAVLRRDRAVVLTCLTMLVVIAWSYVLWLALDMDMGGMEMPEFRMIPAGMGLMMPVTAPWQEIEFAFVFVMWAVMMVGMMTPSAAPLVLLYARVGRHVGPGQAPFAASAWFAGGYLVAWVAFSLIATITQWTIERAGWLGPTMASVSNTFGGLILIGADYINGLRSKTPACGNARPHCSSFSAMPGL